MCKFRSLLRQGSEGNLQWVTEKQFFGNAVANHGTFWHCLNVSFACSSTIIQGIEFDCRTNPILGFTNFYFNFKDQRKQSVGGLIRSLIYQLCRDTTHLDVLTQLYNQNEQGAQQPHGDELTLTLCDILSQF